jgi:hypothetical protein
VAAAGKIDRLLKAGSVDNDLTSTVPRQGNVSARGDGDVADIVRSVRD